MKTLLLKLILLSFLMTTTPVDKKEHSGSVDKPDILSDLLSDSIYMDQLYKTAKAEPLTLTKGSSSGMMKRIIQSSKGQRKFSKY